MYMYIYKLALTLTVQEVHSVSLEVQHYVIGREEGRGQRHTNHNNDITGTVSSLVQMNSY